MIFFSLRYWPKPLIFIPQGWIWSQSKAQWEMTIVPSMIRSVMEVRESNAGVGSSLSEINLTWTNTGAGECGIGGKEEELGACTIRSQSVLDGRLKGTSCGSWDPARVLVGNPLLLGESAPKGHCLQSLIVFPAGWARGSVIWCQKVAFSYFAQRLPGVLAVAPRVISGDGVKARASVWC